MDTRPVATPKQQLPSTDHDSGFFKVNDQQAQISSQAPPTPSSGNRFSDNTSSVAQPSSDSSPIVDSQSIIASHPPTETHSSNSAAVATSTDDGGDSLDEEWIQKAKAIVGQTHDDPYKQSKEISKVKANYLKTHYNKDIKVAEDQSL